MTVERANVVMREIAARDPDFARTATAEQWGERVGCSVSTVAATSMWQVTMEQTARGRSGKSHELKPASERSLTRNILAARPDPDAELRRLNAEDEADKREQADRQTERERRRGIIRE